VLIGARADGHKELVAVGDGYRESTESWSELLRDLKRRGMRAPVLAIGDGLDPLRRTVCLGCQVSSEVVRLIRVWALVVERGMATQPVVEALDVVKDGRAGVLSCGPHRAVQQL
jgi:transposase-like protein